MAETMSVDLWSDVICPFCYLGSRQLGRAIAQFEHGRDVVVIHHAFELDPNTPLDFTQTLEELVATKYAMPVEKARELHRRLEAQAQEFDMTWSFASAKPTNSFDAHRLIALSATQGLSAAMSQRLFQAYFSDGLLISDRGQLNELARAVGVVNASSLWESDAFSAEVRADETSANELGITGVPAILIDEKFMVLGAQGVDQMVDVLRRAWERRAA
ncbi:MAG TPA: DsbA family oxidoreductase [Acidimicrobiales bacterium]|nr:DsbA family oxidoreductase [Acidimicrobiales bacterium]